MKTIQAAQPGSRSLGKVTELCALAALALILAACGDKPRMTQGYVDADYLYLAAPQAGTVAQVMAQRGASVAADAPLLTLQQTPFTAARREAEGRLTTAQAQLRDLERGLLPSQIAATDALLRSARAALQQALADEQRARRLQVDGLITRQDLERAQSDANQAQARVDQMQADLRTAQSGARAQQIAAARANVQALTATLTQLRWSESQSSISAPVAGEVVDVLYQPGEWVMSGRPVVVMLPQAKLKIVAFVAQSNLTQIAAGKNLHVQADGLAPFEAQVDFIAPQVEYTPPVIYSREQRAKLVTRVELRPPPELFTKLHPGQPVDVLLP